MCIRDRPYCSLRSRNCTPHFQNRGVGAAPGLKPHRWPPSFLLGFGATFVGQRRIVSNAFEKSKAKTRTNGFVDSIVKQEGLAVASIARDVYITSRAKKQWLRCDVPLRPDSDDRVEMCNVRKQQTNDNDVILRHCCIRLAMWIPQTWWILIFYVRKQPIPSNLYHVSCIL